MLVVEAAYLEHHLSDRPRTLIEAQRAFKTVNEFMAGRSRRHKAWRVAEFDLLEQRAYARHMAERGLSAKSISTALSFIGAAANWAAKDQVVKSGRTERQIRILSYPVTIESGVTKVAEAVDEEIDDTPRWIPQPAELARFIDAIDEQTVMKANVAPAAAEMIFRFVVVALNTWARREAVTDLRKKAVDFPLGLVHLNPQGRKQTKKRRPIIRLTDNLRAWLLNWNEDHPVRWYRQDRSDLWDGFRAVAAAADLPGITPHVLRHFMNSRAIALGVPAEERSMWLGHKEPTKAPTTEIYEHATPDFLERAREATDRIMVELDALARKRRLVLGEGRRQIRAMEAERA